MYQCTRLIFRYLCTGIYKTIYETINETIHYLSIYLYQPTPPICQSIFLSMHACIYVININLYIYIDIETHTHTHT